jgi:hypothetical protein
MAELGFLGITAYASELFAWVVVILAAYRRSRAALDRALCIGVLASLVGVAVHNVFDNLSVHGLGTEMGLLVGLCTAIGSGPLNRERESS